MLQAAVLIAVGLAALSISYHYLRTGVAPVPAMPREIQAVVELLRQADVAPDATIYELGCGWGGLLMGLARAFPEARLIGVERSPVPWAVAWLRARGRPRIQVRREDFFHTPLADAGAVTCYLMLRPMAALRARLDDQLAPGTPVVALCFWFRDRTPVAVRTGRGLAGDAALYTWRLTQA